jgi:hypothetical protein
MRKETQMKHHPARRPWTASVRTVGAALALSLVALPAPAQEEWEWEAGEGYHQEEWYDPTDWMNEDGMVSYEYDDGTTTYEPYEIDSDVVVYDDEWEYGYHYDYAQGDWDWGWHYEYNTADLDYEYHYDELDDDWDYGYHYDEFEYYTADWWKE